MAATWYETTGRSGDGRMGWLAIPFGIAIITAVVMESLKPKSPVSGVRSVGGTLGAACFESPECSRLPGDSVTCAQRLTLPSPIQQGYGGAWPYPGPQIELWPYDYLQKMYR